MHVVGELRDVLVQVRDRLVKNLFRRKSASTSMRLRVSSQMELMSQVLAVLLQWVGCWSLPMDRCSNTLVKLCVTSLLLNSRRIRSTPPTKERSCRF